MFCLLILLILPSIQALTCPNLYDYTGDTVRCVTTCPPNSKSKDNKCLLTNQYTNGNSVYKCERGWVDSLNSICCSKDQYIITANSISSCFRCNTRVYGGGKVCCPGSSYADFSNQENGVCTSLGTGQCSGLTMRSTFQVCCRSGLMYSIQQQKCISPANNNCQNNEKVCCGAGKKLQYINNRKQYICVTDCSWKAKNNFYCQRKFCNQYDQSMQSGPLSPSIPINSLKLSLTSCCVGLSSSKLCITQASQCFKKFVNRGWSACCNAGQFYILSSNSCSSTCGGVILFQFFCMTAETNILSLQSANGEPKQSPKGALCNNKPVSQSYPVCCPVGFYINDTNGCQLCHGRIIALTTSQLCCGFDQYYNTNTNMCEYCNGVVNVQGNLCCPKQNYFSYSSSGIATCVSTCSQDDIYKGSYCCQSLTSSQCKNQLYQPTICNPSYFIPGACRACPNLCSLSNTLSQICTINAVNSCQKQCEIGSVYFSELKQCLSCSQSCLSCSQPFDPYSCNQCKDGYTKIEGRCSRCASECLTCSNFVNSCLSCPINSIKPVFFNNACISSCQSGRYLDLVDKSCKLCESSCLECLGSSSFQCSKCKQSQFLSQNIKGSCRRCPTRCKSCYGPSSTCFQCQPLSYLSNLQCRNNPCEDGYVSFYEPSLNHYICLQCHQNCKKCEKQPSNCKICQNSSYYLNNQTGVNLCILCTSPCMTCSSVSTCTSCHQGFFLSAQKCIRCHSSCQTCINGSQLSCKSCLGQAQLVSGKCVGCSSMCKSCDQNQNCLQCNSEYFMYNGTCLNLCPNYTFLNSQRKCIDCPISCSTCTSTVICLTCSSTHPFLLNSQCLSKCPIKYYVLNNICTPEIEQNNNTNPNTDNNTNTNNNTNPNINNNTNLPNNTNNNNTDNKINNSIQDQIIDISTENKNMRVVTILKSLAEPDTQLDFYIRNTKTNQKQKLPAQRKTFSQNNQIKQSNSNTLTYNINIPDNISLKDGILQTQIKRPNSTDNSYSFYNSKSVFHFIFYDYATDPLKNLQYVGLCFTILIGIFSIITKLKGHFIAEQANTIILHMMNFIQVVYLFKNTQLHTQGMYHFLNGFGYMHVLMFPNFFFSTIPPSYAEYPQQKSLIPDANFIRNAGSSISFMLMVILITIIGSIASYAVYRTKKLQQLPYIRKITRLGLLGIHSTYLNILFSAVCYLIQPYVSKNPTFATSCRIGSIIMIIIIIIAFIGSIYHFYKTYNSDVLQHYYTIRQAIQNLQILSEGFILSCGVGKPLLCLTLIPLEIIWFIVNYLLYRYGQGDHIKHHIKFIVSTLSISIAYLMLSLSGVVNWIIIVVIVSIVVLVLIVYSVYQIVGLYYSLFFKQEEKIQQPQITNDKKIKQNVQTGTQF